MSFQGERLVQAGTVETQRKTKEEVKRLVEALDPEVQAFLGNLIADKQQETFDQFNGSRRSSAIYLNDYLIELFYENQYLIDLYIPSREILAFIGK